MPLLKSRARSRWMLACAGLLAILTAYWGVGAWREYRTEAQRRRCEKLRAEEAWQELAEVSASWTMRDPNSATAWLYRAESAEGLGNSSDVAEYLGRVPDSDPRAVPALVERATLLFEKLNRPEEAIDTCHRILKIDPRVSIARQRIIFFYALTLQRAAMIREIREALQIHREPPEAYIYLVGAHWLFFGNLYELNTRWLKNSPENERFLVARAMHVIQSTETTNPEKAREFKDVSDADELLRLFPHNTETIAWHLEQRIADADIDAVEALLAQVTTAGEQDARIWTARGWAHDARGDAATAEESFQKALAIDPYSWQVYHYLADLCRRTNRLDKVPHYEHLYQRGKRLRDEITRLRDARSAPRELLEEIAGYARECGDELTAESLMARLEGNDRK